MKRTIITIILLACIPVVASAQLYMVTVQPIQVRNDDGTGPVADPLPVEVINKVWEQAGISVEILPMVYCNWTAFLDIGDAAEFGLLKSHPLSGRHPDPLVLNIWFVQSIYNGAAGVAYVGQNFILIDNSQADDLRVAPHLIGHNLRLMNTDLQFPDIGDDELNLMNVGPTDPVTIDNIYPDGMGALYLDPRQIVIAQASQYSVLVATPVHETTWGNVKALYR